MEMNEKNHFKKLFSSLVWKFNEGNEKSISLFESLSVRLGRNYFYPRLRFQHFSGFMPFFFFTHFSFRGQLTLFTHFSRDP